MAFLYTKWKILLSVSFQYGSDTLGIDAKQGEKRSN